MAEVATPSSGAAQRSPYKQPCAITEAQKQALIDNFQLELTERARKLRAQYALQAQGLRTRLELRINRIPHSLRKMKMQDLVEKHAQKQQEQQQQQQQAKPAPVAPTTTHIAPPQQQQQAQASPARHSPAKPHGLKRTSEHFTHSTDTEDKENSQSHTIPNPKKRAKPTTVPTSSGIARLSPAKRPAPAQILSPRSNNSRTFPRSPLKSPQLAKPPPPSARPASRTAAAGAVPKLAAPKATATRTGNKTATTMAPPTMPRPGTASSTSTSDSEAPSSALHRVPSATASESSIATTVVRNNNARGGPAAKKTAPAAAVAMKEKEAKKGGVFKNALSSLTGSRKGKAAAASAAAAAAAAAAATASAGAGGVTAGGRVLRKRG